MDAETSCDVMDVVHAGDDAAQPIYDLPALGPDYDSLFAWPRAFLQDLSDATGGEPSVADRILSKFQGGISLVTDYSGVGSAEIAFSFIQQGLADFNPGFAAVMAAPEYVGLLCERATDMNSACRKVLMYSEALDAADHSHGPLPKHSPKCIFGSLEERIDEDLLQKLRRMQSEELRKAQQSVLDKHMTDAGAYQTFGRAFLARAMEALTEYQADPPARAWCHRHEQACDFNARSSSAALKMAVAGATCVDWSALGLKNGWLGKSGIAFVIWAHERRLCKDKVVILENVMGFDDEALSLAFPNYSCTVFRISPHDLGVPATRARKYMVLLAPGLTWSECLGDNPASVAAGFDQIFKSSGVTVEAASFFAAPPDIVASNRAWEAASAIKACDASRHG